MLSVRRNIKVRRSIVIVLASSLLLSLLSKAVGIFFGFKKVLLDFEMDLIGLILRMLIFSLQLKFRLQRVHSL